MTDEHIHNLRNASYRLGGIVEDIGDIQCRIEDTLHDLEGVRQEALASIAAVNKLIEEAHND